MSQPTVVAVMLVNGRPDMVRRAVESFQQQTYVHRRLLLFDSGSPSHPYLSQRWPRIMHYIGPSSQGMPIGGLRNEANRLMMHDHDTGATLQQPDIICHFDSDDVSHPNRIAEQVALLQSSGAECVGYNEMLFWREPRQLSNADVYGKQECEGHLDPDAPCDVSEGETWLYSNPNPRFALGTSLCYLRKTWEAHPFPDLPHGEDTEFLMHVNCYAESSVLGGDQPYIVGDGGGPRMIASIHSGNTSPAYRPEVMRANEMQGDVWKRVPAWDQHCEERMHL